MRRHLLQPSALAAFMGLGASNPAQAQCYGTYGPTANYAPVFVNPGYTYGYGYTTPVPRYYAPVVPVIPRVYGYNTGYARPYYGGVRHGYHHGGGYHHRGYR